MRKKAELSFFFSIRSGKHIDGPQFFVIYNLFSVGMWMWIQFMLSAMPVQINIDYQTTYSFYTSIKDILSDVV